MRRGLVLFAVLFAAYAATLGLHADDQPRYTAAESHRLLVADSIVEDRDVDVADQYRERAWRDWHEGALPPGGRVVGGRRLEPAGIGTPLLIAPAYAIGGATLVELWCAALLALAFVLAVPIARRVVPDPWPARGALLCGLSPPALAAATTIAPEPGAALLITAAAALALRVREQPRLSWATASAALLAPLPWLSARAGALGIVIALALFRWLRRRQRALAGLVSLELVLISGVAYVSINERLFGGLTPASARLPGAPLYDDADLVGVWPLLRWAPVLAVAGVGAWLLWRSRRDRLAVIAADQVDVETAALLSGCLLAGAGALALFSWDGAWLVAPELVLALPVAAALVAWGLRFAPRAGALLALATLAQSALLLARVLD